MSPLVEFLDLFAEEAEKNCALGSKISLKELPKEGGLYAELGEGFVDSRYYDKTEIRTIPVLLLCRNQDQVKCLEQLDQICYYFSRLDQYPGGKTFSWLDTEVVKVPSKIGRDADGCYHTSCILNCKLYY